MSKVIPKIIHYCWFGGAPLPEEAKACIDSWRRYCPDYKIMEWNESNFDVMENVYCREAYEARKWAFVSDYARLWAVYEYGGVYMDTDIEVVRSLDPLLAQRVFMGFENDSSIMTALFGMEAKSSVIAAFLSAYKVRHFRLSDDNFDLTTNVEIITRILVRKYGLHLNGKRQNLLREIDVYPMEVFSAKSYQTGWILRDSTTYAIHHFSSSWLDEEEKQKVQIQRAYLHRYIKRIEPFLSKCAGIKAVYELQGCAGMLRRIRDYIKKRL